jgi:hypothetical protein
LNGLMIASISFIAYLQLSLLVEFPSSGPSTECADFHLFRKCRLMRLSALSCRR